MNKIYLDKLCEFTNTTYKNYYQAIKEKENNFDEQIEIIKQNLSLNEKGIIMKYNYIDLTSLIPDIEYNELVLINPICFSVKTNVEWFNLLNSLLFLLNDDYIHKTNIEKKVVIDTFDKTFKKKINIDENLDDKTIEKICSNINTTMYLLSEKICKIYNQDSKNTSTKLIVVFNKDKEYFPVINWDQKIFKKNDYFVNYLNEYIQNKTKSLTTQSKEHVEKKKNNDEEEKLLQEINEAPLPKIKKVKSNVTIMDNYKDKSNDFYEEVVTNENYALYISEAVENIKDSNVSSNKKNEDGVKKKKKNSKDIFMVSGKDDNSKQKNKEELDHKEDKVDKVNKVNKVEDESVFNPTEKITINDIKEIKKSIKNSTTLPELQAYAIKLSIGITQGSTKTGKPKNKTKSELMEEIEKYIENVFNKK